MNALTPIASFFRSRGRQLALSATFVAALAAGVVAFEPKASADVVVAYAPPAARIEVAPAYRPGWAWAPGYWAYVPARGYVWRVGHWIGARPGYTWIAPRWGRVEGHWRMAPGGWARR